jgi:hypothetical protein
MLQDERAASSVEWPPLPPALNESMTGKHKINSREHLRLTKVGDCLSLELEDPTTYDERGCASYAR